MEKLLTEKEMSDILGLHITTLYRLRKKGLPFKKVGKSIRYDEKEVKEWIEAQKEK